VARFGALSARLAGPNCAHSTDRGYALPRRSVTRPIHCLRSRESLIGHNRGRDVAVFMDAARGRGAPSREPGTRPQPAL